MAFQEQFDFYMTLAKPLALSLTNTDCRARACAWLKHLLGCEDSQLKVDYIKLLLFVIQKNSLIGPFSEVPPTDGSLQPFPDNVSLSKMMLRVSEKASGEVGAGDSKPQVTEFVSTDLKQFVALQTLPGERGIQCYLALGSDEMNKWEQTTSSSCSCNNLTNNSDQSSQPLEHLQPATFSGFPPRYSPMIRQQRGRRMMEQMPYIPPRDPGYQPLSLEPKWLPTKREVYWLKRMNKMIKRPGGPDTIFMDDVKRYYANADRSQTTDEDWDPLQSSEGPPDEFVDELSEGPSVDNMRSYPQATMPTSPQQQATGTWMKPVYQDTNTSYESETRPYMSGRPPMQTSPPPPAYDISQSCDDDEIMLHGGGMTCSPAGKTKPRWAKKTLNMDLDFSDQSEKFYSLRMETPQSHAHYGESPSYNDSDYSQSQPSSSYTYDYGKVYRGDRSSPPPQGRTRGPPGPGMYPPPPPRRPASPELEVEEVPSRIVVFHCQCACKK